MVLCAGSIASAHAHAHPPDNATLTIALYITPVSKAAYIPVFIQFEKESGIKIKVTKYTHDFEFSKYIDLWLKEKIETPDLLYGHASQRFLSVVEKGYVHPITHLWESEGWKMKYPQTLIDWVTFEGEIYALPYVSSAWGLFYKKSLIRQFGPVPRNWKDFVNYCETLIAAGIPPFPASSRQPWIASAWFEYFILRRYGIKLFNDIVQGQVSFHDPRIQSVLMKWKVLIDKGFFTKNYINMRWEQYLPFFFRNEFAFIFMSQRLSTNIFSETLKNDIEFIGFPKINDTPYYESAPSLIFFVAKNSKKKQQAEEFIKFISRDDIQSKIAEKLYAIPANSFSKVSMDKYSQAGQQILARAKAFSPFFDRAAAPEFEKFAVASFAKFLSTGNVSQVTQELEMSRLEVYQNGK